jgi:Cys-rich repeat protein
MSSNVARAVTARSVASCLIGLFFLTGCSNGGQPPIARPQHRGHTAQALSSGYAGTATFDVPVVDPSTWQGSPMGTGTWSTGATPPLSGGPTGVGFYDTQSGVTGHYLMIGNFTAGSGTFFGIVSEGQPLSLGTKAINNTTLYAGIFDAATGDPVAMASSGTITLTAAGLIGGRITGSFSGTLDDITSTACTSSAQCRVNEQCLGGACVPVGCTSNAQCGSGQICQSGVCITTPGCTSNAQCGSAQICQSGVCIAIPACTSNAQCGSGRICQSGVCITTPGCTSNAQCATGQTCQSGVCIATPACSSNAQCGSGRVCQAGQCVVVTAVSCNGLQGGGSYSGTLGNVAVCSAFTGGVSVTKAFAVISDDGAGLALYVMDPALESAGAILPINACPSGPSTVAVSNATFWDQTTARGTTFYARHPAITATVTYTQVGTALIGSFWLSLDGGGQVKGSFNVF